MLNLRPDGLRRLQVALAEANRFPAAVGGPELDGLTAALLVVTETS